MSRRPPIASCLPTLLTTPAPSPNSDMSSELGPVGASLAVGVIFCTVVEFGKALDPNPAVSSMFGKF